MPEYLAIILTIAACFIIIASLYFIYLTHKFSLVNKKMNFLVEDITYKLDSTGPFIDSLIKISSYVDVLDVVIKKNMNNIKMVVDNNKKNLLKFSKQLEEILKDEKQQD